MAINEQSGFSQYGATPNGKTVEGSPIHHASQVISEAKAFGRSLSAGASKLNSNLDLAGRVQRNPIQSVLIAAGVGYILGGGLFSPLTKKALKVGLRLALIPFVKGQISAFADAAGQGQEPGAY
jgi:hypothetical protein